MALEPQNPFSLAFLIDSDDEENEAPTVSTTVNSNATSAEVAVKREIETSETPATGSDGSAKVEQNQIAITADSTTICGAIENLVKSRANTLLANPLNYHGYLQGQVIERIFAHISRLLMKIYESASEDNDAQSIFSRHIQTLHDTKTDMYFIQDHMVNLIERIIRLRIDCNNKTKPGDEIIIPFVPIRRPAARLVRHRIRRKWNVDELERVQRAQRKQERAWARSNKDFKSIEDTRLLKRKLYEEKLERQFEREQKRLLIDNEPLPGFEFDEEEEPKEERREEEGREETEEPSVGPPESVDVAPPEPPSPSPVKPDPRRINFATKVRIIPPSNAADASFDAMTREILSNASMTSANYRPPAPVRKRVIPDVSRRFQLKQQSYLLINPERPEQRSSHGGAAGSKQNEARLAVKINRSNRPQPRRGNNERPRHSSNAAAKRQQSRSTSNVADEESENESSGRQAIYYHGNRAVAADNDGSSSEEYDYSEDEDGIDSVSLANRVRELECSDSSDDDDEGFDDSVINPLTNQQADEYDSKPIGRVIVGPTANLRPCRVGFFSSDVKKKVRYIGKIDICYIHYDDMVVTSSARGALDNHTILTMTTSFTKNAQEKTNLPHPRKNVNLVSLPHTDQLREIFKRTNPRMLPVLELRDHYAELCASVENLREKALRNRNLSRWLICDTLLQDLDENVLKNTHVTRVEFPKMPTWLISEVLEKNMKNNFPVATTRIFVACGYDIQLLHSDDSSSIPLDFVRDLYEWLLKNIARRAFPYQKEEYNCKVYRVMPIIVLINIPEVGHFARQFRVFNERIKKFVDVLNENEEKNKNGKIEIFDWAKLVTECKDRQAMQTVAGRIKLLIEHLKLEHGLLYI